MFGEVVYSTFLYNNLSAEDMIAELAKERIFHIEYFGAEYTHWNVTSGFSGIKQLLKKNKIASDSFHLPVEPLAGIGEKELRRNMGILEQAITFAAALGAKSVVAHAWLSGYYITPENRKKLYAAVSKLAGFSARFGMELLIENIPVFKAGEKVFGARLKDLLDIITHVNADNLKICLDTGHSLVNGEDVAKQLDHSGGFIRSVHLSDNHGVCSNDPVFIDKHLPPGDGLLDWKKIFLKLFEYPQTVELVIESSNRAVNESEHAVLERSRKRVEQWMKETASGARPAST